MIRTHSARAVPLSLAKRYTQRPSKCAETREQIDYRPSSHGMETRYWLMEDYPKQVTTHFLYCIARRCSARLWSFAMTTLVRPTKEAD